MDRTSSNYSHLLHNAPNISSYGSVNGHVPPILDKKDNLIDGKISIARRFFIFLTLFDVLFTFLIWIICLMVSSGSSIDTLFRNEVINYSIETSLFDIVILALARLFLIVLFYVLIKLSHWWVVSVTTAGSCLFIIAKVFLYKWNQSSKTASVVLLLCSFVLSWAEAWFLSFKVIPNEAKALNYLAKQDIERVPVLSHPTLSRSQSDDGSAFYSPPDSDVEENVKEHDGSTISEVEWLSPKNSRECSRPSTSESSLDHKMETPHS